MFRKLFLLYCWAPLLSMPACSDNEHAGGRTGAAGAAGAGGAAGAASDPWIKFDPETVVARSNVVLAAPNTAATQFMPVGNGSLGAACTGSGSHPWKIRLQFGSHDGAHRALGARRPGSDPCSMSPLIRMARGLAGRSPGAGDNG